MAIMRPLLTISAELGFLLLSGSALMPYPLLAQNLTAPASGEQGVSGAGAISLPASRGNNEAALSKFERIRDSNAALRPYRSSPQIKNPSSALATTPIDSPASSVSQIKAPESITPPPPLVKPLGKQAFPVSEKPVNPQRTLDDAPAAPTFIPFTPNPLGNPPLSPTPSELPTRDAEGFESSAPTPTPGNYLRQLPDPALNPSANPQTFPTKPREVEILRREAINLNQALELALRNNTQLQSARLTLEQSQAALKSAEAALFPTIDTQFILSRESSASAQRSINIQNENNILNQNLISPVGTDANGNVQLTYNIYTGGERGARIERARKEVDLNRLEVDKTAAVTRFETTDRYYRLQDADAQVAIAQAAVEDTTQSLRDAQLLEQAGLGTRFDTLRAEGDLATANQDLTSAIARQRIARRNLVEFLNLGQHIELTAADEIREAGTWPLSLEDSITKAYKNRAELEQQLVQREMSEQDSYIALSEIKPKVDFVARYEYLDNFDDAVGVADGYSFQAQVRWRMFDGGRAFAEARRAYRGMDIANTNFTQQRNQIRQQVEEGYFNLISSQENISSTRKNVERFEEALRLARLRFQAGVGTQTDVINAQRDLTDARGRFLQAIIGYNQSLNALQRSVSNLPDNRLFQLH